MINEYAVFLNECDYIINAIELTFLKKLLLIKLVHQKSEVSVTIGVS